MGRERVQVSLCNRKGGGEEKGGEIRDGRLGLRVGTKGRSNSREKDSSVCSCVVERMREKEKKGMSTKQFWPVVVDGCRDQADHLSVYCLPCH